MNVLRITKADLDENGFYKEDGVDFDGDVVIEIKEQIITAEVRKGVVLLGKVVAPSKTV